MKSKNLKIIELRRNLLLEETVPEKALVTQDTQTMFVKPLFTKEVGAGLRWGLDWASAP